MADVLPVNFPVPSEAAVATYSFQDLLTNTGTIVLYGATAKDDGTTNVVYFLTSNPGYGSWLAWSREQISGTSDGVFAANADFDYEVQTTIHIVGTGHVLIPFYVSGGTGNANIGATLSLYHVATDSTETQLATGSIEPAGAPGTDMPLRFQCGTMALLNLNKVFKKGEKIRLSIDSAAVSGTSTPVGYIGHDPIARSAAAAWEHTPMQLLLPVRINL